MAATYPEKPIRTIVPFAPGSGIDIVTRIYAPKLGKLLNTKLIIENMPGAGGNLGAGLVARAAPDGYTILSTSPVFGGSGSLYKNLPFNPEKDLTPVALLAAIPSVLITRPTLGVDSLKGLIDKAKKSSTGLTFGSTGVGTLPHIVGEAFALNAGLKMLHVPYRGTPQIVNELMGGRLDIAFANLASTLSQITSGHIPALAVTSQQRSSLLPNVPTMVELGYKDFIFNTMIALMCPSGVSAQTKDRLNRAVIDASSDATILKQLNLQGIEVLRADKETVLDLVAKDRSRRERIIRDAHIEGVL